MVEGAFFSIAEWCGAAEGELRRRRVEREAEAGVEVRGTDGFGGVEGLEGRREENDEHCGGEKPRESHQPQHFNATEPESGSETESEPERL